jgi:Fe-S cluster assembly protein SufD
MRLIELKGISEVSQIVNMLGVDDVCREYIEQFTNLPFPDKKSEAYRYADAEKLWEKDLTLHVPDAVEPRAGKHIVITDGVVTEAPSGLDIKYIDDAKADMEHYDPVYYLSHALSPRAIEISMDDGMSLNVEHHLHTPNVLIPYRIILKTKPSSHVQINERFVDMAGEGSVLLYGYDVDVECDTTLCMTKDQTIGAGRYVVVASHSFEVSQNARLVFKSFDFGSGNGVQQMRVVLGERAHAQLSHLLYAKDTAKRGTVSQIIHRGEHSTSEQIAKNILKDGARGIFDALIRVDHSARYTKAHQNSKAILLDNGAYMASKPQLEIYIDELEASHGSTTGQLDEKQLFYLRSRGISESEARKMLILAFANEIIDTIEDKNLREQIHSSFEQAYYGETYVECIETCHGCEEQMDPDVFNAPKMI